VTEFERRHVVITGGDGALGQAVVTAFADAGAVCHLPLHGQNAKPPTVRPSDPHTVPTWGVDLTNEGEVASYYSSLPALFASIHLAGGYRAKAFVETSRADLEQMLGLNLATTFFCCREAVKRMKQSGGGRIVNVGARVSEAPIGGAVAYSVSKAGVAALTRSLAIECKPDGILVNAVLPSIIDTAANRAAMPKADHASWPKPEEIARAILWLASPENTLTSGTLLPVYGKA
jgi:NAD(P)-dependent dehydrogenase (short-subunit alcohol dehydrogenase family)